MSLDHACTKNKQRQPESKPLERECASLRSTLTGPLIQPSSAQPPCKSLTKKNLFIFAYISYWVGGIFFLAFLILDSIISGSGFSFLAFFEASLAVVFWVVISYI